MEELSTSFVLIVSVLFWSTIGGAASALLYPRWGRRAGEGLVTGVMGGIAGSVLGNTLISILTDVFGLLGEASESILSGGTVGLVGCGLGSVGLLLLLWYFRPPEYLLVFLVPGLILYSLFMAIPLLDSLRLSTVSVQDGQEIFIGLGNFEKLFGEEFWSSRLWNALGNNLIFFAIHMLVQNPVALLLATILTRRGLRGVPIFRTALFAPTTLSYVIVGFIWTLMLSPIWGLFKGPLKLLGLPIDILGQTETALVTVSLVSVWQFVGLPMMLFVASLLSIPDEILDAALVDGANTWQVFWRVKFPLILPTVGVVIMLTFVGNFNAFALIYTMEGALAGPNLSTDILGTFFYRTTFGAGGAAEPNFPMGTTIASVMFGIIGSVVLIYFLFIQRRLVRTEA